MDTTQVDRVDLRVKAMQSYLDSSRHFSTISTGIIVVLAVIARDLLPGGIATNTPLVRVGIWLLVSSLIFFIATMWGLRT